MSTKKLLEYGFVTQIILSEILGLRTSTISQAVTLGSIESERVEGKSGRVVRIDEAWKTAQRRNMTEDTFAENVVSAVRKRECGPVLAFGLLIHARIGMRAILTVGF